jgi:hypothetical protein
MPSRRPATLRALIASPTRMLPGSILNRCSRHCQSHRLVRRVGRRSRYRRGCRLAPPARHPLGRRQGCLTPSPGRRGHHLDAVQVEPAVTQTRDNGGRAIGDVQASKDPGEVVLDRILRDPIALRNLAIRTAFGHAHQNIQFPSGQRTRCGAPVGRRYRRPWRRRWRRRWRRWYSRCSDHVSTNPTAARGARVPSYACVPRRATRNRCRRRGNGSRCLATTPFSPRRTPPRHLQGYRAPIAAPSSTTATPSPERIASILVPSQWLSREKRPAEPGRRRTTCALMTCVMWVNRPAAGPS